MSYDRREDAESVLTNPHPESREVIEKAGFLQLPPGQAEAFLAAIVLHSTDAIYSFDVNGVVLTWNPAAELLFGYSSGEMIGRNTKVLVPSEEREKLHATLTRLFAGERVQQFETVRLAKDGSRIQVAITLSPVYGDEHQLMGLSAVVRDIRDRRASEQERQRLILLVENSPDLIGLADFEQRVVFLNAGGRRLLGIPAGEEVRKKHLFDYLPEDERPRVIQVILQSVDRQGSWSGELSLRRFDNGAKVPVFCNLFVVGNPALFAFVARDLTERKRAEAALIQSERLAASGRMAATVAHEINNPLESIMNLLFLLERETLTPTGAEYLHIASQELQRVSQIARQTLGFYRSSTAPGNVCLHDVLESVIGLFSAKLQSKKILVRRSFEVEGCLRGVTGEFRQVFSNLISNAIDAMPEGGTLAVATRNVDVTGRAGIEVRVEDTGEGLPQAQLDRIFEPFFTTKSEKGTGLGLWVSRNIIHQYGGDIAAYTEENPRRTVFTVTVPTAQKAA